MGLELRLKDLIISGQALLNHTPDLKHVHKLDILWNSCRTILQEVWPNSTTSDLSELDMIDESIRQFCLTDPDSMSFRYPTTKNGTRALPNLKHINIRNLHEVMSRISLLLDSASTGISEHLLNKLSSEKDYS